MTLAQRLRVLGVLGASAAALAAVPSQAESVADFYSSNDITLWVGYSPGGGYDTYARTVARYMGAHIPGKPDIVVKNRPGAGSLLLTNELYNILPKDGAHMGVVGRGMPMEPLLGNDQAKFDASKFNWLGSANNEVSTCIAWATTGITSLEQLKTRRMIVGGTGPGADTDVFPTVLNNLFGAKMKLVTGYPGGTDINFAIERGELEGRCGYSWSSLKSRMPHWVKEKKVNIFLQMSTAKHPELPDVPFVMDLAKTSTERQILQFVFARQAWGRPFLAPPGIPADRVAALKSAFMATMNDPKFLADARKQKLEVAAISGDEIGRLMTDLYATPKTVVQAAKVATENVSNLEIAKAVIPVEDLKGKITRVRNGGREVSYNSGKRKGKLSVSGSRTEVKVGGKKVNRKELKVGMSCDFKFQGTEAKTISCGG